MADTKAKRGTRCYEGYYRYPANSLFTTYDVPGHPQKLQLDAHSQSFLVWGEKHYITIQRLEELATIYFAQKYCSIAREVSRRVLTVAREATSEFRDLAVVRRLRDIGATYRLEGNIVEAEKLFSEAFDVAQQTLGKENRGSLFELANLWYCAGRVAEALAMMQ